MIGIIVAMSEELNALKQFFKLQESRQIYNKKFLIGTLGNKDVVITECGIGKVNAAFTTQLLITNFDVKYVINTGVAGGLQDTQVGDIVVATKLVQHDFDITGFGHELGYISCIGKYIETDSFLVEKSKKIDNKVRCGVIATGDIFVTDIKQSHLIESEFNALAVEMEGAAVAQICFLCNIPFIVIRAISDNPNSSNFTTYENFLASSTKKMAEFMNCLIGQI